MLAQGMSVAVRLGLLILLTAAAPPPPAPADASEAKLSAFLQQLGKQEEAPYSSSEELWKQLGFEPPLEVIYRAALERPEPAHALSALQSQYALSPRAARLLLSGHFFAQETGYNWHELPALAERTLVAWEAAAHEAPGNLAVLASLLDWTPRYTYPGFHTRFWQALEPRTTPVDVLAPLIRERLAAPPLSPFTEHPLAQAPAPAAPWRPVEAGTLHAPRDFRPVRIERSGDTVVLLALSQRTDPVGEVSGGAYWLLLSQDGGRTWGEPLYTGLREYRPYELAEQSMLPMLEGDTLRLEASVRELDEKRIRFPPIALPLKREQSGLYLQAPLSALHQDSDADGLTDLIEERWLTHPQRADTDADGLRDGEDPLPHVPASRARLSPQAQLFTTFFAHLKGKATPPPLDADFLALDRDLLSGTRLSSRILVFTPEELEQAQGRFGSFYPMELEAFFDADADRALLLWDERWRGGLFLCQKKAGRWVLTSLSSWAT